MEWYYILGTGAAGMALLGGSLTALRKLWRFAKSVDEFLSVAPALVAIGNEFKTNGGSSLRDAVDRIEAGQESDRGIITKHIEADAAFQARVEPYLIGR